ncbi:MAG: hypothetical protein OHK0019_37770 [Saprospiraceae bacterium]
MVWAVDIIEDGSGGYLALTQLNEFVPSPGIPIEGTLTYGNMVTHLTESGMTDWEVTLPTSFWQNLASLESNGYAPASQIHLNQQSEWVLPYAIHLNLVPCTNPLQSAFTNKVGVVSGSASGGSVLFNNIFFGDTTCSKANIVESYMTADTAYLLNDDRLLNLLQLIKIDPNGNIASITSLPPSSFIADAVFSEQGLIILESANDSFGLRHLNLGGTMLNQVAFSCPLGAFPSKTKKLENGNYLLLFKEDNPSTGEINSILWLLDGSMQQLWEETYEENIVDFITDSDHRIYCVSRAGFSTTNITVLNADGSKANETHLDTPDFVPLKIVLTEDESALLMGVHWELSNQKPATEIIKTPLDAILLAPFPLAHSVELKLSPNPAVSFAQLPFTPDRLQVLNMLGERVSVSLSSEMLNVSALPPGIYQVLAEKDGVPHVGKLAVGR